MNSRITKSLFCAVFALFTFFSCSDEMQDIKPITPINNNKASIETEGISLTNEEFAAILNFTESLAAEEGTTIWTEASGRITMIGTRYTSGYASHHTDVRCSVPSGYVVVGGGAVADYGSGAGAMLTASYPSSDKKAWLGSSKDHLYSNSHRLSVYAVGIKINGVSEATMKNYVQHYTRTSISTSHPETEVAVNSTTHIMTGGGAKVNWSGYGNLLTESYPKDFRTWFVKSKDHKKSSPATITAYAVGIAKNISGFGTIEQYRSHSSTYTGSGAVVTNLSISNVNDFITNPYIVSCPGGRATFSGSGRMLYGLHSDTEEAYAASKDHADATSGYTYAYLVALRDPY